MPRFKNLPHHVRQGVAAILKQRLGTKERIVEWLNANDADRTNGAWFSLAIAVPRPNEVQTLFDTGEL
jgi:hypothetical protein